MRILIGILLLFAMLAHAALGCCRMRDSEACARHPLEQSTRSHCRHQCNESNSSSSRPAEEVSWPAPAHDHACCCRGDRQSLPMHRVKVVNPPTDLRIILAPPNALPRFAILAKADCDRYFDSHMAAPAVRLHVSYQIFLI